jgi:hypothetical protein
MKLNNITCLGYSQNEAGFSAVLTETTREAILALGTASLVITADDGKTMETYTGFGPASQLTEDLAMKRFTVLFPAENVDAQRITKSESEINILIQQNRQLMASLKATRDSVAFQEECIVEMAGVLYG